MSMRTCFGVCRACQAPTMGSGDVLCRACWPRVPRALVRVFMRVWRRRQAGRGTDAQLRAAEEAMVIAARGGAVVRGTSTGSVLTCGRCRRDYPRRGRPRTGRSNYCLQCETPAERIQRARKKAWWQANRGRGAQGAA